MDIRDTLNTENGVILFAIFVVTFIVGYITNFIPDNLIGPDV